MYQPNDGVVAYEHVIKTLLLLSENLDSQTQQQIISIVPFPKGVSNEKIRNLMYKATELVTAANSISTIQKIATVPKDKYSMDVLDKSSEIHLKQNIVIDTSESFEMHEKFIPSVSEVFKGFPPNEISTIHNHLSIDRVHNWNQCNVANISRTAQQDTMYLNKKLYRSNIMTNQQNKKIQEYFGQEFKGEQEAIQRDIYKMDVVYCEEEKNCTITSGEVLKEDDVVMNNFIIHEKLKTSLQKCLERAGRNIVIEFPILPQTEPSHETSSTSSCWKLVNKKNLENNNQLNASKDNMINYKITNTPENMKKYFEKKSSALSAHIYPKSAQVQVLHKNLNTAVRKAQTVECEKKDNKENLLYKSAVKQAQKNCLNTLQQATSITELATFKRHYYNTLLNIQKAKMAVTNSLAISSLENCFKYEPYHSNHSNQEQQFLQQHGSFINPQYAVHTMTPAELPNIHNSLYTWVKCNNWKHPSMKQLRLTQQFPFYVSKNKD